MPSWKKVIVSGSDASLNSLNVINGITGSLLGTSSYASNADLLDGLNSTAFVLNTQTSSFVQNSQTSSFVQNSQTGAFATFTALNAYTSSINTYTSSLNAKTSSFATTGSNNFIGTENITGSLTISSSLPIDLTVIGGQNITGSLNVSGSTTFTGGSGTTLLSTNADTLIFTGSLFTSGSSSLSGSISISGSLSVNGSNVVLTNQTSSFVLNSQTSSMSVLSASFAATASFALNTQNIDTGSLLLTSSFNAYTSSINTYTSSLNSKTSSFATTGSNTFIGNQIITGSLTLSSSLDIELNVIGNSIFTGSLTVTQPITGSLFGTASFAISSSQASTASVATTITVANNTTDSIRYLLYAPTGAGNRAANITTTKFVVNGASGSMGINKSTIASGFNLDVSGSALISGSLVVFTGSGVEFQVTDTGVKIGNAPSDNHTVTGSLFLSGSLTSTGTLTAQTLVVQTITSSVIYSSGSNVFGNSLANTQVLTGSVIVTGSLSVNGSNAVLTNQTSSFTLNSQTSSFATTGSNTFIGNQVITGSLTLSSSADVELNVIGNTNITGSLRITGSSNSYILGDGNVGIGTSTPTSFGGTYKVLDLYGTNAMYAISSSGGVFGQINAAGADALYIGTRSNHNVNLTANNANVLTLTSGSNVGIGTTSPSNKLTVQSDDAFNQDTSGQIVIKGSTTTTKNLRIGFDTGNNYGYVQAINTGISTQPFVMQPFGGNVGIGTISPSSLLHLYGTGANTQTIRQESSSSAANAYLVQKSASKSYITGLSTDFSNSYIIYDETASAMRLAVTTTGNVGIGTSSPSAKLDVSGSILITTGSLGVGVTPSATNGRIDASNDVVAFSTSDIRFKENINPIPNALDKLNKIGGYTFDWKTEEELVSLHGFKGHDVGIIAQEIESILPEVVTTRDSGYKAVKYEKIVPLLIQAIKEQQEQIKELQDIIKNK